MPFIDDNITAPAGTTPSTMEHMLDLLEQLRDIATQNKEMQEKIVVEMEAAQIRMEHDLNFLKACFEQTIEQHALLERLVAAMYAFNRSVF